MGLRVFHVTWMQSEQDLRVRALYRSPCLQWKHNAGWTGSLSADDNLCSGFSLLWLLGSRTCPVMRREN